MHFNIILCFWTHLDSCSLLWTHIRGAAEEHLLLKCSFYYSSRCKLLETIKNNINHSNFEKLSFGDKFIWLLNSESKDTLICMCDFLLKSHCFG